MSYEHLKPRDYPISWKRQIVRIGLITALAATGKAAYDNRDLGSDLYENRDVVATEGLSLAGTKIAEALATDTPTVTPTPTHTPRPTKTPQQTNTFTPEPSQSPTTIPTAKPTPIPNLPESTGLVETLEYKGSARMILEVYNSNDPALTINYFGNFDVGITEFIVDDDSFDLTSYKAIKDGKYVMENGSNVYEEAEIYTIEDGQIVGPFNGVFFSGNEHITNFDYESYTDPRQLDSPKQAFQPETHGKRPVGGNFTGRLRTFEYLNSEGGKPQKKDARLIIDTFYTVGPVSVRRGEISAVVWKKDKNGIVGPIDNELSSYTLDVSDRVAAFIFEQGEIAPKGFALESSLSQETEPTEKRTSVPTTTETTIPSATPTETSVPTKAPTATEVATVVDAAIAEAQAQIKTAGTAVNAETASAIATAVLVGKTENKSGVHTNKAAATATQLLVNQSEEESSGKSFPTAIISGIVMAIIYLFMDFRRTNRNYNRWS